MALPAAAQQPSGAPSGTVSGANVSDATVSKVGAAMRQVAQIEQIYSQRLQSANTPAQKQDISKQASNHGDHLTGSDHRSVQPGDPGGAE
jgi:hypothetical protein